MLKEKAARHLARGIAARDRGEMPPRKEPADSCRASYDRPEQLGGPRAQAGGTRSRRETAAAGRVAPTESQRIPQHRPRPAGGDVRRGHGIARGLRRPTASTTSARPYRLPLHMEKYLLAARKAIDRAIVSGDQPRRERWRVMAEQPGGSRVLLRERREVRQHRRVAPRGPRPAHPRALGGGVKHFPADGYSHLMPIEKTRFNNNTLKGLGFTYPSRRVRHPGSRLRPLPRPGAARRRHLRAAPAERDVQRVADG